LIGGAALGAAAMVAAVEDVVGTGAIRAIMMLAAAPRRAATQHGLDRAPLRRRDGTFGLRDITGPVLAKQIRELHFDRGWAGVVGSGVLAN
jgi:hypothetical protein